MPSPVAVSSWTLRTPDLAVAAGMIADAGFAAVELGGQDADVRAATAALRATGLQAPTVCPLLGADRDLASPSPQVRRAAVDALTDWLEVADAVGAAHVIVVPSDQPSAPPGERADSVALAAESLAALTERMVADGPGLVIEALNRYETHLVHTLGDAVALADLVGDERIAVMVDVFHAQMEEDDPMTALDRYAERVRHVHLADNQRRAPGTGSRDFAELRRRLTASHFRGSVALEFLPCGTDELRAARTHLLATGWEA